MRIGVFFGGQSREREISYSGGRTACENLDKTLFEAIPIFVDSFGNFIILQQSLLYQSGLRDFYTSGTVSRLSPNGTSFNVYAESTNWTEQKFKDLVHSVGKMILPQDFHKHFDFAFIALHGQPGEDGSLQGLLEWYNMPYSSCGLLSSAIGIDKITQNELMATVTGQKKAMTVLNYQDWNKQNKQTIFDDILAKVGLPFVAKAPHQGSSIGVAIIKTNNIDEFIKAVNRCFFVVELTKEAWRSYNANQKQEYLQAMVDLDKGIGFPVYLQEFPESNFVAEHNNISKNLVSRGGEEKEKLFYHPTDLWYFLDEYFDNFEIKDADKVKIFSKNCENEVLFEQFISGQEFSCGVIQDENGKAIALPPTEIISASTFDFDSKYKAGGSRKIIPINTSNENIEAIQKAICKIFSELRFNVCARIDGFLTADNAVILHDPNTIPGMSPSSLIFKQTAEIGLNVTQTLTYFICASLQERIKTGKNTVVLRALLADFNRKIQANLANEQNKTCQYIDFEASETSFVTAKKQYAEAASKGQHHLKIRFKNTNENTNIENAKVFELIFPLLMKDSLAEMLELLELPRHEMIVKNIETTKDLVKKYTV